MKDLYECWFSQTGKPWLLNDEEHKVISVCHNVYGSTTNSELSKKAKLNLPAAQVGITIARLRMKKMINYEHIETGRMASGSGRYRIGLLGSYFGKALQGEDMGGFEIERLPNLP
jgi:hypothetical protein